jgi:hypothetical protein
MNRPRWYPRGAQVPSADVTVEGTVQQPVRKIGINRGEPVEGQKRLGIEQVESQEH